MSMRALFAARASRSSSGMAYLLIWESFGLLVGYTTASTASSWPLVTVICTCTGPYRVCAALPVTVTVDVAPVAVVLVVPVDALVEPPLEPDGVEVVGVVVSVA